MSRDETQLLYAETHEWVEITETDGETIATIGISAFAIEQLNDLVYMELPESGDLVRSGEQFGEVESVKAVSPLYSPVTGEITDVNTALPDELEKLNASPYDEGWIIQVRVTDTSSIPSLMDKPAYDKQCAEAG